MKGANEQDMEVFIPGSRPHAEKANTGRKIALGEMSEFCTGKNTFKPLILQGGRTPEDILF